MDDILRDIITLFSEDYQDNGFVQYGKLVLTTAPKEGKANTLLADHLFSPSLLLAERIERGLIPVTGRTIVELGAGCALPSLLSSTLNRPPQLVVITDYPDETIIGNLKENVNRNRQHIEPVCDVRYVGYEWGKDVSPLLALVVDKKGYDIVILSDLLHFDRSHDVLLSSLTSLLRKSVSARTYVAAGKYTASHLCDHFLREAEKLGMIWEEGEDDPVWRGDLDIRGGGLDREQLGVRKGMCRWWTGRWAEHAVPM